MSITLSQVKRTIELYEKVKIGPGEKVVKTDKVGRKKNIEMTLTSPNCPVADSLPKMVKENISSIEEIKKVDLKLVWSPPWTKDMMSEEAKLELNL